MGKYTHLRGALTEDQFWKAASKTRMTKSTLDDLKRYFVGGERPSEINRKQLMGNRISRFVLELEEGIGE